MENKLIELVELSQRLGDPSLSLVILEKETQVQILEMVRFG